MNAGGTANDVNRCARPTPQFQFALLASLLKSTQAGPSVSSLLQLPRRWAKWAEVAVRVPYFVLITYHMAGGRPPAPPGVMLAHNPQKEEARARLRSPSAQRWPRCSNPRKRVHP